MDAPTDSGGRSSPPSDPKSPFYRDPTLLTQEAVDRGVAQLQLLIESRLDAMDKAVELVQHNLRSVDDVVFKSVAHRADLADCQFNGVNDKLIALDTLMAARLDRVTQQIADQDRRFEQSKLDSKAAIDAALQAAKEAVGKTESVVDKQISGIVNSLTILRDAQSAAMEDLKERINRTESAANLTIGSSAGGQATVARMYAALGALIAVVGIVIAIVTAMST